MFFSLSSWLKHKSAEDVLAEQTQQEEADPFSNLTKKEKKKKKKQVNSLNGELLTNGWMVLGSFRNMSEEGSPAVLR